MKKILPIVSAAAVTIVMWVLRPASPDYLVALMGIFVVVSVWTMAAGIIYDSKN